MEIKYTLLQTFKLASIDLGNDLFEKFVTSINKPVRQICEYTLALQTNQRSRNSCMTNKSHELIYIKAIHFVK